MNDEQQSPSYTYETLSRFSSTRRLCLIFSRSTHSVVLHFVGEMDQEPRETRACSVQVRSNASPFANTAGPRRETTHIIYPEYSSSTDSSEQLSPATSEAQVTNAFARLTESLRLKNFVKNRSAEGGRPFPTKCKAFIWDNVINRRKGEEWIASLDGKECDYEESEAEDEWMLVDRIDEFPDESEEFFPVELEPTELEPRMGFSLDIPADAVRKGRKIGEGAFGHVYRAIYKNRLVVLKEVAPHHYHSRDGKRFIESLKSELCVLGALGHHPNVLACYGGCIRSPNVFMLCQLMDMNLADLIYGQRNGPAPLPVELALHITHDILAGLNHLHEMTPQVVHRDIKPENILLNKRNHACVADFGLSRTKSHTYINTENTHAGTPEYLAPEAATGKLDEKMDVYSVGVILWECLTAQRPWEGYHPFAVFLNVAEGQRLPFPEDIFPSQEKGWLALGDPCFTLKCLEGTSVMCHVRNAIERCWLSPADRRPSCLDLLDDIEDILLEMYNYGQ